MGDAVIAAELGTTEWILASVVVALVVATRVHYERTRTSQFDLLQVQAQAAYSEALELPNVGQMREALNTALGLTKDGLSVHPDLVEELRLFLGEEETDFLLKG